MQTPRTEKGILFETKGTLYQYTHYVQTTFQFDVERDYRQLVIEFQYDPLWCETGTPQMREMMRQALHEQIQRQDEPFVSQVLDKAFPIKNQISLAVRAPDMWLGERHGFTGNDVIVLGGAPTDGFIAHENKAGAYQVVLHVFAVYSPECRYSLAVRGED